MLGAYCALVSLHEAMYGAMSIISYTDGKELTSRLTLTVKEKLDLAGTCTIIISLNYTRLSCSFNTTGLLTIFEYLIKETFFERRLQITQVTRLFANYHFVVYREIPVPQREDLILHVPIWWSNYEISPLLLTSTPILLVFHPTLAIQKSRCGLLYCIYSRRVLWLNVHVTFPAGSYFRVGWLISCLRKCIYSWQIVCVASLSKAPSIALMGCWIIFCRTGMSVCFCENVLGIQLQ